MIMIFFRYRADHVTGYVADVSYEGEARPYVPVKPYSPPAVYY